MAYSVRVKSLDGILTDCTTYLIGGLGETVAANNLFKFISLRNLLVLEWSFFSLE